MDVVELKDSACCGEKFVHVDNQLIGCLFEDLDTKLWMFDKINPHCYIDSWPVMFDTQDECLSALLSFIAAR